MKRRPFLTQLFIYGLLLTGLVVFGYPFIYTLGSSMKVDRELYTQGVRVTPTTPNPSPVSPFVDKTFFDNLSLSTSVQARALPVMRQLIADSGFEPPSTVDSAIACEQIARGLLVRLARELPPDAWQKGETELFGLTKSMVTRELAESVFREVYRYLGIGGVRVRSLDLQEREISSGLQAPTMWKLVSGNATFSPATDQSRPFAQINYDFSDSKPVVLVGTFELPFAAEQLQRVRVELHPDDTWHTYTLDVEHLGKRWVSNRTRAISNFDWFTQTWQFPSTDDNSTKLRFWTILKEEGTSEIKGNQIRLTLTVTPSSPSRAWMEKMKLNYSRVFEQIPFWRYVRVSVFLVIANIVLTLLSSSLVAYAFARIQWPGRDFCFVLMLATMMIPGQVLMIPHFVIWKSVGAFDTLTPLWLGSSFGSAFFIFMMRQFMRGIPRDLEDAGRIDGLGFLGIYWHVILPLVKPSLAAIAIFTFMGTWNNFMGPLIYITDQRLYPLAFGLYAFNVQVGGSPTLVLAGSVLMTLPVILIFFLAQRYFVQGVTLTGVKG